VLDVSESDHPDLFWAIRGAGANFGVVGSLEFQLHAVGPTIVGGLIAYPVAVAVDVFRFYRDLTTSLPDDVTLAAGLTYAPDGSGVPLVALLMCHSGARAEAERFASRVKAFGAPVIDAIGPMPYTALNSMLDGGFPNGARSYWKSRFLNGITDNVINVLTDLFARSPSSMNMLVLEHIHGAAARRSPTATAFPHRGEGDSVLIISQWRDPAEDDAGIRWAREVYAALQPSMAPGGYVNYLAQDEASTTVAASYGPNYARLRELKQRYDPENLFHINHNIR
jgi:FAD/FMN-containing dehydrogenase